jgi:hypothetical protein
MGVHELIHGLNKTRGDIMINAKSGISSIGTVRKFLKEGT